MSPRPSLIPDAVEKMDFPSTQPSSEIMEKESDSSANQNFEKNEPNKTANRASSCRVCLKSFKPDDFSKTCFECKYRVCEDCASYSKVDSAEDLVRSENFYHDDINSFRTCRIPGVVAYVAEKCHLGYAFLKILLTQI